MNKEFTYIGDLSTPLDYARWRLNDMDPLISSDSDGSPMPFLWDATYEALFEKHGVRMGMYFAARTIAIKISQEISSFGEAGGVRFSYSDRDYYLKVAEEILDEPDFETGGTGQGKMGRIGLIKRGQVDTYDVYRKFEVYPTPEE